MDKAENLLVTSLNIGTALKQILKDTIKSLLEDADKYSFQVEKENDLSLLMKAYFFRNIAKEKTVIELEIALINLNKSTEYLKKKKKN